MEKIEHKHWLFFKEENLEDMKGYLHDLLEWQNEMVDNNNTQKELETRIKWLEANHVQPDWQTWHNDLISRRIGKLNGRISQLEDVSRGKINIQKNIANNWPQSEEKQEECHYTGIPKNHCPHPSHKPNQEECKHEPSIYKGLTNGPFICVHCDYEFPVTPPQNEMSAWKRDWDKSLVEQKEQWKPKEGQVYWWVYGDLTVDEGIYRESGNQGYVRVRNCFPSKEEAEAMRDAIQALLQKGTE